jgi:hypothetical protein
MEGHRESHREEMTEDFETLVQQRVDQGQLSPQEAQDAHEAYMDWLLAGCPPLELQPPEQGRLFE